MLIFQLLLLPFYFKLQFVQQSCVLLMCLYKQVLLFEQHSLLDTVCSSVLSCLTQPSLVCWVFPLKWACTTDSEGLSCKLLGPFYNDLCYCCSHCGIWRLIPCMSLGAQVHRCSVSWCKKTVLWPKIQDSLTAVWLPCLWYGLCRWPVGDKKTCNPLANGTCFFANWSQGLLKIRSLHVSRSFLLLQQVSCCCSTALLLHGDPHNFLNVWLFKLAPSERQFLCPPASVRANLIASVAYTIMEKIELASAEKLAHKHVLPLCFWEFPCCRSLQNSAEKLSSKNTEKLENKTCC